MNKILSYPFVFLIRLYQKYVSPHTGGSCRFTPTCSSYAVKALEEWGPVVGLAMAFWRILRCNPFSKGGYDPVPLRKKHRKAQNAADGVPSPEDTGGETPPQEK